MKFYSPSDEPLQIGLTSGHMAVIPSDGVELDPMFHREAVANGAIPETLLGVEGLAGKSDGGGMVRESEIKLAITAMLDGDDEGTLLKACDAALYRSKSEGRDRTTLAG